MAKRKQPKAAAVQPAAKEPASPAAVVPPAEAAVQTQGAPDRLFSIGEYVLLNAVFDAFCLLQLLLVRVFLKETRGLYFFFALLMIGFLLVSVFDYLYDRFGPADEPAGTE